MSKFNNLVKRLYSVEEVGKIDEDLGNVLLYFKHFVQEYKNLTLRNRNKTINDFLQLVKERGVPDDAVNYVSSILFAEHKKDGDASLYNQVDEEVIFDVLTSYVFDHMDSRQRRFHFLVTDDYVDQNGEYVGFANIVFDTKNDPQLYMYILNY